ncbi:MAG: hypothetical protein PHQ86_01850 [Dehalococcoidales bacterium]|nr:hypothetical protein [Dehalococcoidales bacterium]
MPTKNSTARAIRLMNTDIAEIIRRAVKQKISFNAWVNRAIKSALRKR